jgi:hypothetical protein
MSLFWKAAPRIAQISGMLQGSLLTYEFVLEGGPEDSPNIGL